MKIACLKIDNFRGIRNTELLFPDHAVLVGDNNTGKSTVLEAIDLVLGPDRLRRYSPIDEHDFYAGEYLIDSGTEDDPPVPVLVKVEVVVTDLNEEQTRHFAAHLEFWNNEDSSLLEAPPAEETDGSNVVPALRVEFVGSYDDEEDGFTGQTFFASPENEDGARDEFRVRDKRLCGFLFLRTLRTGSRALSLERGSLLDIILRLHEMRLTMWEDVLGDLRVLQVADKPELGVSDILEQVQDAIRKFVPAEWAENPHIRVSDLTREHLRKTLTVFMGTGEKSSGGEEYAAPFNHQGTGTINTLVLALLSMIAELKQNVIFAMEEPEIAIPPHTQRGIVDSVRKMAAQSIFTSHSPYVLEEFSPEQVLMLRRESGSLSSVPATLPPAVKKKAYRMQMRTRFCECLLARRVLIVEGRTEYDAVPAAARRLSELDPARFKTLESIGVSVIDAESDSQVAPLGEFFSGLGKVVYAACDKQDPADLPAIEGAVHICYESPEASFEKLILNHSAEIALRRFAQSVIDDGRWPPHLAAEAPDAGTSFDDLKNVLAKFFKNNKGANEAAYFLSDCSIDEMPSYIVDILESVVADAVTPATAEAAEAAVSEDEESPAAEAAAGENDGAESE